MVYIPGVSSLDPVVFLVEPDILKIVLHISLRISSRVVRVHILGLAPQVIWIDAPRGLRVVLHINILLFPLD